MKQQIYFYMAFLTILTPFNILEASKPYRLETLIKGNGMSSLSQMNRLLSSRNKTIDSDIAKYITRLYIKESKNEKINHDIAFVQMLLETNFLRYGNDAKETQNNFAGIGVVGNGAKGHTFGSILIGVRAHIQHLSAYAHQYPLNKTIVDPRFSYVKRGSAPKIINLTKKWATDPKYAQKIVNLLKILHK